MERRLDDLRAMVELAESEHDASLEEELAAELVQAEQALTRLRVNHLLRGEMDANNAILSIHPGAGGTESQDWAEMLMRMYVRWAENRGYKVETLDYLPGEEAGIRITHIPTGIVVQCQNERSQLKNKMGAMKVLRARLYELERKKKEEEFNAFVGEKKEIGFGSQIRSYVFQPYQLVKDHRTNVEVGNINAVMDGDLDPFIEAYLLQSVKQDKPAP